MGLMDWLFGSRRKRKAPEAKGETAEERARRILDVREAPADRLEAMKMLAARRRRKAVNRSRRKSAGPKRRIRTLERYRDRKAIGRATAENFREAGR